MWRSLSRPVDRYSFHHFRHVIHELCQIKIVDLHNREQVIDMLQSIVEIVSYGDKQDPMIFECFMEFQVLAQFVRVLKTSQNSRIEAPLLQYLSIMIQNMDNEHSIYYCFSNGYINSIIAYPFDFTSTELVLYYMSFLRAVSKKVNKATLCLLVKVYGDSTVSFPLYTEALKFAHHDEDMIRTCVRALTLNIYKVGDDMIYDFVSTPPVSEYFSALVHGFRQQCVHLDSLIQSTGKIDNHKRDEIHMKTEKIVDDLCYFKDILAVGDSRLKKVVTENLIGLFVFPLLLPLLCFTPSSGLTLSPITSLYLAALLIQIVGGQDLINLVASVILYPPLTSGVKDDNVGNVHYTDLQNSSGNLVSNSKILERCKSLSKLAERAKGIIDRHLPDCAPSHSHAASGCSDDASRERCGLVPFLFSNDENLLLATLFLFLSLAESRDLDHMLASAIVSGYSGGLMNDYVSDSSYLNGGIVIRFAPQILNSLLKCLAIRPFLPAQPHLHTGWLLLKLLTYHDGIVNDADVDLFYTSFERSRECLRKEFDGCWFDHIPGTVKAEWGSCKAVLTRQTFSIDPSFLLETAGRQEIADDGTSYMAWQRMVDTVKEAKRVWPLAFAVNNAILVELAFGCLLVLKNSRILYDPCTWVFILHVQLRAFMSNENLPENPPLKLKYSPAAESRRHASSQSDASFGSEVSLGGGLACRMSFPSAGIRDIYVIPVADEASGKLILAEKHPFRSHRAIVIATAPLAGLAPQIDEEHPTWLHLRIRGFDPIMRVEKSRVGGSACIDGRWTLRFSTANVCGAARLLIVEETQKQRAFIESLLTPLLHNLSECRFQGLCSLP